MPSLVIPGAVQLRVIWSLEGEAAFNVLHYTNTTGVAVDQAMANRVGSAIKADIPNTMGPVMPATTFLEKIGLRDIGTAGHPEFIDSGIAVPGTNLTDPLPRQTALVVTVRTETASRSGRGRVYIPGFAEDQNNANGTAALTAQDAAQAFMFSLGNAMLAEQLVLGVGQHPANGIVTTSVETLPDGTTVTHTHVQAARDGVIRRAVTFEIRDAQWDTQRRRNNGRGALVLASLRNSNPKLVAQLNK